ncbi:MAG: DsrH/TusB family sulfur relay protein [Euryarchaeota archaeon]|nr:DsrH/TusB family sulfur relay protein [Euryarchaeota archaeon]MBV1729549.1 DsrH/TusB family sulfur relay protein [Methanobacterium sp.]MBU4547348.1 DsrH/TusB family sulfur relay protein [Euryarchaeota archaeon]MBU4607755.1 DsrH/TusB family sulfur relay protein [Euryarchaeota archaeon]MBV1754029.1 DsrH/TusB family sulfur relay protein [Methanobacterium sp.]
MNIAFLVTKTPQEVSFNNFIQILKLYYDEHQIHLYLIGNGVYATVPGHDYTYLLAQAGENLRISAFSGDLEARSIHPDRMISSVEIFNIYDELVLDLMEKIDQVFSF